MLIPADIMCTDPKSSFATDFTAHRIRGPWPGRFLGKLESPIYFLDQVPNRARTRHSILARDAESRRANEVDPEDIAANRCSQ